VVSFGPERIGTLDTLRWAKKRPGVPLLLEWTSRVPSRPSAPRYWSGSTPELHSCIDPYYSPDHLTPTAVFQISARWMDGWPYGKSILMHGEESRTRKLVFKDILAMEGQMKWGTAVS
jgi:hypothetical protein